jgi:methylthioribulose 1-phosphate dehydratase/enolase-phosphatase E1
VRQLTLDSLAYSEGGNRIKEMELYYLDNQFERGTQAILSELGCSIIVDYPSGMTGPSVETGLLEYHGKEDMTIFVTEGEAFVDLRDMADCWLRAKLKAGGPGLHVKADVFRRVQEAVKGIPTSIIQVDNRSDFNKNKSKKSNKGATVEVIKRYASPRDAFDVIEYHKVRELTCELCRQFFQAGWVTGTGGSISIRHGNRIYMTPSGVQKERLVPNELYVLDIKGDVIDSPAPKPNFRPKLTDCSPLFMHAFQMRNAGAVLHSHAYSANMVTQLFDGKKEFQITHQEMIKGIAGHGYRDTLVVPIIENTPHENELADSLGEAMQQYPNSVAVLVRRHGLYVWGNTWEAAKRHGECLHYLFDMALQMSSMGFDFMTEPTSAIPAGCFDCSEDTSNNSSKKRAMESPAGGVIANKKTKRTLTTGYTHVLFDIEGTTTPISFVKEVLFPYSSCHVQEWLSGNQADPAIVEGIKEQAAGDGLEVPSNGELVAFLTKYVQDIVAADRKDPAVKRAQGAIWEAGYRSGALKSEVYSDVAPAFQRIKDAGKHVCIYSSGSRKAQRLLFQYSDKGDLRPLLSCYFDTTIGHKREAKSYTEIALSLGAEDPASVLFVTDVIEEAQAARQAGMHAIISIRDGNLPLPKKHDFKTVTTFEDF